MKVTVATRRLVKHLVLSQKKTLGEIKDDVTKEHEQATLSSEREEYKFFKYYVQCIVEDVKTLLEETEKRERLGEMEELLIKLESEPQLSILQSPILIKSEYSKIIFDELTTAEKDYNQKAKDALDSFRSALSPALAGLVLKWWEKDEMVIKFYSCLKTYLTDYKTIHNQINPRSSAHG